MHARLVHLLLSLLAGLTLVAPAAAQSASAAISAPRAGEALQGSVQISGSAAGAGFRSAELAFSYSSDPTDTWFPIAALDAPVEAGPLATWDTTTITDGTYDLRLTVTLAEGEAQVVLVKGLRVRNYTPIETATPRATLAASPMPSATPPPRQRPATPTPLPVNPAEVTPPMILSSAARGAGVAVLIFLLGAAYTGLHRDGRPRG